MLLQGTPATPAAIEREYEASGMGGNCSVDIRTQLATRGEAAAQAGQGLADALKRELRKVRLFAPVLDALRARVGGAICVAHLPLQYARSTRRRSRPIPSKKRKYALQDGLEHMVRRCRTAYRGALQPFAVRTARGGRHMNMVYIDMREGAPLTCYLFEPNGVAYSEANPDGARRLQAAWAAAAAGVGAPHRPRIVVTGGDGVQTALGTSVRRSSRVTERRGHAVCGAVTLWMFAEWLAGRSSASMPYLEFERSRLAEIAAGAADEHKERLRQFVREMRADIGRRFAAADWAGRIRSVVRRRFARAHGGWDVSVSATLRLGENEREVVAHVSSEKKARQ